ncbi:MAG: hypothetical protein R3C05_00820 [Pirellulaceae bacterium]
MRLQHALGTNWGQHFICVGFVSLVLSDFPSENPTMPSLENRNGKFRIVLRLEGRKLARSLNTDDERKARLALSRLEDNLHRYQLGTLPVDPDVDLVDQLLSGGQPVKRNLATRVTSVGRLLDAFKASFPEDSIESTTKCTMGIHIKHLKRVLGSRTPPGEVGLEKLQEYITNRSAEKTRSGTFVQPETIKKELATLSSAWRWGKQAELISSELPSKSLLRYPKTDEKPPFRTWREIERIVSRAGLSDEEIQQHWDCLFLDGAEVAELVHDVGTLSAPPFLQPMIAFAAYTGARRSEILRCRVQDRFLVKNTVRGSLAKIAFDTCSRARQA